MPSIEETNNRLPPCAHTLNGRVTKWEPEILRLSMQFRAVPEFCHSGNIVQGGFITGMLDASMAHCCFMRLIPEGLVAVPSLEIKTSFISPGHPGELEARATPVYMGRSTAFMEASLYQLEDDRLIARASSTVKLIYAKPKK